jgi:hypothetical protein
MGKANNKPELIKINSKTSQGLWVTRFNDSWYWVDEHTDNQGLRSCEDGSPVRKRGRPRKV